MCLSAAHCSTSGGRHIGMIVDGDVVAVEQARQFVPLERLAVDVDRRIVGAQHPLPDRRQLIVAVEKKRFHFTSPDGHVDG